MACRFGFPEVPVPSTLRRLPGITSVRCVSALSGEAIGTVVFPKVPELTLERMKATVAKLPGIQTDFDVLVDGQILDDDNEKLCGLLKQISLGEIKVFFIVSGLREA